MRCSSLIALIALFAAGCASPTGTFLPPPTLPPTLVQPTESPTETATEEPFALAFRGTFGPETTETLDAVPWVADQGTQAPLPSGKPTPDPANTAVVVLELTGVPDNIPPTKVPVGQVKPLEVEFIDLHYECRKRCNDTFKDNVFWTYRSFQVLMRVKNLSSDLTLQGGDFEDQGWAPSVWFITDGTTVRTDDYAWQWAPGEHYAWNRPDLIPGAEGEWTWLAEPLNYGEWVSAVEYVDEWGNMYRQEFPKPEGGAFNYVDCGDPKEGSC